MASHLLDPPLHLLRQRAPLLIETTLDLLLRCLEECHQFVMQGLEVSFKHSIALLLYAEGDCFLYDPSKLFLSVNAPHLQPVHLALQVFPRLALLDQHRLRLLEGATYRCIF